jgi:hypothetical protein
MRYAKILIIILISFNYSAKAQICNFCSQQELKELLDLNQISYNEKIDDTNQKLIFFSNENYIKRWYFKYDKCYMYEITILKKDKLKSLIKLIENNFTRVDLGSWEDLDNRIELTNNKEGNPQMQFIPKLTHENLNNNYNNN